MAVLSVSPFYNKPNQEGLYQHYKMLASTGKQIIIYNVPGRTGQNIRGFYHIAFEQMNSLIFL